MGRPKAKEVQISSREIREAFKTNSLLEPDDLFPGCELTRKELIEWLEKEAPVVFKVKNGRWR